MEIEEILLLVRKKAQQFHKQYTPTKEQVKKNRLLKKCGYSIRNVKKGSYHNRFQYYLAAYAAEFNAVGVLEYEVLNGRIDVMWQFYNGENFIAFEIDTSNKLKSVQKLLDVDAMHRVWICSAPVVKREKFEVFGEVTMSEIRRGDRVVRCIYI